MLVNVQFRFETSAIDLKHLGQCNTIIMLKKFQKLSLADKELLLAQEPPKVSTRMATQLCPYCGAIGVVNQFKRHLKSNVCQIAQIPFQIAAHEAKIAQLKQELAQRLLAEQHRRGKGK